MLNILILLLILSAVFMAGVIVATPVTEEPKKELMPTINGVLCKTSEDVWEQGRQVGRNLLSR